MTRDETHRWHQHLNEAFLIWKKKKKRAECMYFRKKAEATDTKGKTQVPQCSDLTVISVHSRAKVHCSTSLFTAAVTQFHMHGALAVQCTFSGDMLCLGCLPVILWIELGGKPIQLPLNFGYHDVMCMAPVWKYQFVIFCRWNHTDNDLIRWLW